MSYSSHQQILRLLREFSKRSMRSPRRRLAPIVATLIMLICVEPFVSRCERTAPTKVLESFPVVVDEVIDGDTLLVVEQTKKIRIRLLGIDAPEVHDNEKATRDTQRLRVCLAWLLAQGRKSKQALLRFAGPGRSLLVQARPDHTDRYQRMLGTIFSEDGKNLNVHLVAEGFAEPYFQDRTSPYEREIRQAYELAKKKGLGMWGEKQNIARVCSP